MRLVDIEDTSLLKTIADGRLSAKAVWRLIKAQPIVDAVPVRHAKWEDRTDNDDHYVYCSECGDEYIENDLRLDSWVKHYFKYCPNCGARMDAERKEE